jgi:hypothetical protein
VISKDGGLIEQDVGPGILLRLFKAVSR